MADEILFTVEGYPPAKSEALSMLGSGHRHVDRVVLLLEAARDEIAAAGFEGFDSRAVGFDLTVFCPRDGKRSDATNYLGGVADVLKHKAQHGVLDHLGELAQVALFANDRQIEEVTYRWEDAIAPSYEVRFRTLDAVGSPVEAEVDFEARDDRASPAADTSAYFTRASLERDGFIGWLTFDELRATKLSEVSAESGVYVVWRSSADEPAFLDVNPGGRFKGRDPTVDAGALSANWVVNAEIVYIGKANSLKRRLGEFARFGAGAPIGHWGGRLIWQLADSVKLRVAWKPTSGLDAQQVESELIARFRAVHGKPPFANDPHLMGR